MLKNVKREETIDQIICKVSAKIIASENMRVLAISENIVETSISTAIAIIGETSIRECFVKLNLRKRFNHGSQICASKRPKEL